MTRKSVDPEMDLKKEKPAKETNTGGAIPISKRAAVDPDMDLSKQKDETTATLEEKEQATMPGVGAIPTGKKAVKKVTPGMG